MLKFKSLTQMELLATATMLLQHLLSMNNRCATFILGTPHQFFFSQYKLLINCMQYSNGHQTWAIFWKRYSKGNDPLPGSWRNNGITCDQVKKHNNSSGTCQQRKKKQLQIFKFLNKLTVPDWIKKLQMKKLSLPHNKNLRWPSYTLQKSQISTNKSRNQKLPTSSPKHF